jgi:putative ABC transport system ATP-binding protein
MSEIVVRTTEVAKTYARGKELIQALRGVDMEIKRGETIAIVGRSGSGKTTLLNLIAGLDKPTGGKVKVDETNLRDLSDSELTNFRLKNIGFIFQFYNLNPTLSAVENVEVPMSLAGTPKAERHARAIDLLTAVGLQARTSHMPDEMSGGEQQRVAVARALANNPPILLGDEPTGDLDSKSTKALMDLLRALRKEAGMTMIFVTHDPLVVSRCDRAIALRDGKLVQELSRSEIEKARIGTMENEVLEGVY